MRSGRLLWLTFLAITALALVAAACGGNDNKAVATATRGSAAASPTLPAASPTSGSTGQPTAAPSAETVDVSAGPEFKFDTNTITVKSGSQVTLKFSNKASGVRHNWSAYTDSTASEPIPGAKTEICTGPCEEEITFTAPEQPGNYFYRCDVHNSMNGTLVVE